MIGISVIKGLIISAFHKRKPCKQILTTSSFLMILGGIEVNYGKTLTRKKLCIQRFFTVSKIMITESMQFVSNLSNTVSQKLFDNNKLQKKLF